MMGRASAPRLLFPMRHFFWIKSTACVTMAVQQKYGMDTGPSTSTSGHALMVARTSKMPIIGTRSLST